MVLYLVNGAWKGSAGNNFPLVIQTYWTDQNGNKNKSYYFLFIRRRELRGVNARNLFLMLHPMYMPHKFRIVVRPLVYCRVTNESFLTQFVSGARRTLFAANFIFSIKALKSILLDQYYYLIQFLKNWFLRLIEK